VLAVFAVADVVQSESMRSVPRARSQRLKLFCRLTLKKLHRLRLGKLLIFAERGRAGLRIPSVTLHLLDEVLSLLRKYVAKARLFREYDVDDRLIGASTWPDENGIPKTPYPVVLEARQRRGTDLRSQTLQLGRQIHWFTYE